MIEKYDRRETVGLFLKCLTAGVATVASGIVITEYAGAKWLDPVISEAKQNKELFGRLFGFLDAADFTVGRSNIWYPEVAQSAPADDLEACQALHKLSRNYFPHKIRYDVVTPPHINVNGDLCSLGGPVTHEFVRFAMGYPADIDKIKKSDIVAKTNLPFTFNLEIEDLDYPRKKVVRQIGGKKWKEPNWNIIDREGNVMWVPQLKEREDTLESDYLMLLVMPNTISKNKYIRGQKKHLIIAGAHGVANTAVYNILSDTNVLNRIENGRKGAEYFLTVIKIDEIVENLPMHHQHTITVPIDVD